MGHKHKKGKRIGISVPQEPAQSVDGISNDAVEEIPKQKTSPYLAPAVKLFIGREAEYEVYSVHKYFAEKSPVLQLQLERHWELPEIRLNDIDITIGHTFVHYLYTGTYQTMRTLRRYRIVDASKYRKSVLTYRAAQQYQLPGLRDLARTHMGEYGKSVPINFILDVGKDVYRRLGDDDDDEWYSDYLRTKIWSAFEEDEHLFSQEYFTQGLGEVTRFDKFLVSTMVRLFSEKISALKEHASHVDPSDVKMNATSTEHLEPSTSPAHELPPSPSRTFSDQSGPISPRETSPEPEQAEVVEVAEKIYDRLEPITEVTEDYPVERYDGYQEITQECM